MTRGRPSAAGCTLPAVIESGHEHRFRPVSKSPRPDGGEVIHSRCTRPGGGQGCGLEEQRTFGPDGKPTRLRYRYSGIWLDPVDLLRLLPVPIELCPTCGGDATLEPCPGCEGVGVVEPDGGGLLRRPDLTVAA